MADIARANLKQKTQTFRYVAAAGQDRIVRGTINAASEVAAQTLLTERGLTPINLETAPAFWSLESQLPSFFRVKPQEVITFSRQLATLLESGITLLPAIQMLGQQTSNSRPYRRILNTMVQDLGSGKSFYQAISRHSTVFNDIYTRTISVGEKTGSLEKVLRELADHMESQSAFAKKIKGALTYPVMVLSVGFVVGIILMTVALPPMVEMFSAMDVDLPITTRILIGTSNFMNAFKLYLFGGMILAVVAGAWYIKQPKGRRALDRFKLTFPVIGQPAHMAELARMGHTMSMMLSAGLSLQEIMEALPDTTTNSLFRDALSAVRRGLFLGQGLSYPMSLQTKMFPPLMLQMIRVGEESNSLESNMRVVAEFYETTAGEKTAALLSMITPVSTIGIAVVAGFIALSVITPMYSITGSF